MRASCTDAPDYRPPARDYRPSAIRPALVARESGPIANGLWSIAYGRWLDSMESPLLHSQRLTASFTMRLSHLLSLALALTPALAPAQATRARARDLGVKPGIFAPGPLNAITDVAGVKVGQTTIVSGD